MVPASSKSEGKHYTYEVTLYAKITLFYKGKSHWQSILSIINILEFRNFAVFVL